MLLVPCRIGLSDIDGLGLFSEDPIAAGTVVWRFSTVFDMVVAKAELAAAPDPVRSHWAHFAYEIATYPDCMCLDGDDGRFMNHSDTPNLDFSTPGLATAIREIAAGEELTCNYDELSSSDYEMEPARRL